MRNVIVTEFMTLDGVMEAPDQWSFSFWNDEIQKYKFDELFASDALLLGRVTYEIFAGAWPTLTDEENLRMVKEAGGRAKAFRPEEKNLFPARMNSIAKYVVSKTLDKAEWNNSHLIKKDVAEEIAKLEKAARKRHPRGRQRDLVQTLIRNNLVDEYRLMVFPLVLGTGQRLFRDGIGQHGLKLAGTKTLGSSGVIVLSYTPADMGKKNQAGG